MLLPTLFHHPDPFPQRHHHLPQTPLQQHIHRLRDPKVPSQQRSSALNRDPIHTAPTNLPNMLEVPASERQPAALETLTSLTDCITSSLSLVGESGVLWPDVGVVAVEVVVDQGEHLTDERVNARSDCGELELIGVVEHSIQLVNGDMGCVELVLGLFVGDDALLTVALLDPLRVSVRGLRSVARAL